jgi:hypothetical protein
MRVLVFRPAVRSRAACSNHVVCVSRTPASIEHYFAGPADNVTARKVIHCS